MLMKGECVDAWKKKTFIIHQCKIPNHQTSQIGVATVRSNGRRDRVQENRILFNFTIRQRLLTRKVNGERTDGITMDCDDGEQWIIWWCNWILYAWLKTTVSFSSNWDNWVSSSVSSHTFMQLRQIPTADGKAFPLRSANDKPYFYR